jgi:hypothetical protein
MAKQINHRVRLCVLSYTHGLDFTISDCDIFWHGGDWSPLAYQSNFEAMYEWLDYFVETSLHLIMHHAVT